MSTLWAASQAAGHRGSSGDVAPAAGLPEGTPHSQMVSLVPMPRVVGLMGGWCVLFSSVPLFLLFVFVFFETEPNAILF